MLVTSGKESKKWLMEYSGFNMQEMDEDLIRNVVQRASENISL